MNSYENSDNIFGKDNDKNDIDIREPSKGKNALDALHEDIIKENEKNLNLKISDIYGVDYDEANEIHINYHSLRLRKMIEKSETLSSMSAFIDSHLDLKNLSTQVAFGEITENTCIDILINVMKNQKETRIKDRYINFYS
ncbi:hypothetical protein [Candidatus Nitrosocosmicus arcticus]|uniref:Uncharacterized protein n=1 Tax=Candidatus Nitrosocosmicus arcticus TaxID=2035267 RepID=A0A557SQY3_9ARCH|nr:hypothetical protein [Candidatus Nitrosocosmicus arcticus]TVP39020.1 hypothetical protein NARC_230009 [Candidatus Nitrosocosmicus arcticus]